VLPAPPGNDTDGQGGPPSGGSAIAVVQAVLIALLTVVGLSALWLSLVRIRPRRPPPEAPSSPPPAEPPKENR
jgi:hypothetical protein